MEKCWGKSFFFLVSFFLTVFGLYRKTKLYPLYKILYILFYIDSHVFIIVKVGQGVSSLQDFL